jgi:hypothetical protein
MSTVVTSPTNQSPFTVTAVFSEVVTGFNDQDLVITNGEESNFTPLDPSDIFTFAVTPDADGLVTIVITAGAGIGNSGLTLPTTLTLVYDGTPPDAQLTSGVLNSGDVTDLATVPLTATFSEAVTGFVAADLSSANGNVSGFTVVASDTYTLNIVPQDNGPVTVTIPAGVAADLAGNPNLASTPFTFTYNADTDPLTVLLETPITDLTNETAVPFTATFSSPAMGLAANEIDVGNGTAGNLTDIDGATYTFYVSPTANTTVTAQIPAGVAETEGGTPNDASNIVRFIFDDTPPVITPTGPLTLTHLINTPYTDPGATASDNIDGVLDPAAIKIDDTAVDTTTLGLYPVTYTVADTAGNIATAGRAVQIINYTIYLPLVVSPYTVDGEIVLAAGERVVGQTTFVASAVLDLSGLIFPAERQPDNIRAWVAGDEIPEWESYDNADTYQLQLRQNQYGAQTINVQFQAGSATSNIVSLTLFYVPNGDFTDNDLSDWQIVEELPVNIQNGYLRLGDESFDCNNGVTLGKALASLNLEIPIHGDYTLHVKGVMYTEDQNPDNDDTYDAFEIHLGDALAKRYSNQEVPINCDIPIRTMDINFQTSLAPYTGSVVLSLENWSRFDMYFNTYTDIEQVWVTRN